MSIEFLENSNGPTLGYASNSGVEIIEKEGKFFKNLSKDGILKPYEDWTLDPKTRAEDLAKRLSIEEIAGLMLYSKHQSVPPMDHSMFPQTYGGKVFSESGANSWDLSDEQIEFINNDNVRHILLMMAENPTSAAKWNNKVQELCERNGLGIPANISSDPRHGMQATAEFNMGSNAAKRTSEWPEPLGLAATFDKELVRNFGNIAAKEYRAMGIATALSPQVDIATEPRWFRFNGTFGEDSNLSTDLAEAYVDGFQTSSNGDWGLESVNAMVKHWPGGGSGEGGRDAHFGCGKYAVYPNKNYDEHMKPFVDGAFKLTGNTKKASAVMPYYTISTDLDDLENVGNSYNKHIITDLLRNEYNYDEVVCTDWLITADETEDKGTFFSGKCWGVEHLSVAERHYKVIEAGVDQFGGNNEVAPVLEAYEIGVKEHGEEFMRTRFEKSASRLLLNIFRVGLFENPYLKPEVSDEIVNCEEFAKAGFDAQLKSIVMLKNKNNVLPIKNKQKVFIPKRLIPGGVNFFGLPMEEKLEYPIDIEIAKKYFDVVDNADEADFAITFILNPVTSIGYSHEDKNNGGNGYVPISLQYRPYTAEFGRDTSLFGDKRESDVLNRSYNGKTVKTHNESDLDLVLDTKKAMGDKPVIVSMTLTNPCVLNEFESKIDGLLINYGINVDALFKILNGEAEPSGLLPMQMPKDMKVVELQSEDLGHDMECHIDELGNSYDFAYGLNWSGVIKDERTEKYKK